MTNPDDWWRHQAHAAPHVPPHDAVLPGMPLPSTQPAFARLGEGAADYPVMANGTPGGGTGLGVFLLAIPFAGPIFGTLYPLASGTALVVGLVVNTLLPGIARGLGPEGRVAIALIAAIVVFWMMSRLDHRLGEFLPYRVVRHVIRLALIGAFFSLAVLNESGGRWLPTSIAQIRVLTDQRHLIAFAVGALLGHLLLTKANDLRRRWHIALQIARLRPW